VRYDTGDSGGLLGRADLAAWPEMPTGLVQEAPELILWVSGRASDAVVFYGTNLMAGDINHHLLSLPAEMGYGGFFELSRREESGIAVFRFKVYVRGRPGPEAAQRYARAIVEFLQSQSLEFKAKYQALCASAGRELIQVELADAATRPAELKHKFIVDEDHV
jgi:phenylacetate-CoA ligase